MRSKDTIRLICMKETLASPCVRSVLRADYALRKTAQLKTLFWARLCSALQAVAQPYPPSQPMGGHPGTKAYFRLGCGQLLREERFGASRATLCIAKRPAILVTGITSRRIGWEKHCWCWICGTDRRIHRPALVQKLRLA